MRAAILQPQMAVRLRHRSQEHDHVRAEVLGAIELREYMNTL